MEITTEVWIHHMQWMLANAEEYKKCDVYDNFIFELYKLKEILDEGLVADKKFECNTFDELDVAFENTEF